MTLECDTCKTTWNNWSILFLLTWLHELKRERWLSCVIRVKVTEITGENFSFYRYKIIWRNCCIWSVICAKLREITLEYFCNWVDHCKRKRESCVIRVKLTELTGENFSVYRHYINRNKRWLWSVTRAKLSEITGVYYLY